MIYSETTILRLPKETRKAWKKRVFAQHKKDVQPVLGYKVVIHPSHTLHYCSNCHARAATEPHPCPYRTEIKDDCDTLCHCCTACTTKCWYQV